MCPYSITQKGFGPINVSSTNVGSVVIKLFNFQFSSKVFYPFRTTLLTSNIVFCMTHNWTNEKM
jgi:hypothetical protein